MEFYTFPKFIAPPGEALLEFLVVRSHQSLVLAKIYIQELMAKIWPVIFGGANAVY
jgi:hypothetical protein